MHFREIRHQDRALSLLRRALTSGRMHHACLFDGPSGVGKERTARALAARLLCHDDSRAADDEACGTCDSCRLLETENHPDLHIVHRGLHKLHADRSVRAGKGLFLSVHVIRQFLIEPSSNAPSLGRRRVFIIRDAERMNEGAQNALLKTLEEPPGSACLILVTAHAQRLLQTIRSRCQAIRFDWLPDEFVATELQRQVSASPQQAGALASLSQGSLGGALGWYRADLLGTVAAVAELLERLPGPEAFAKRCVDLAGELAVRIAEAENPPDPDEKPKSRGKAAANVETDQLRDALRLVLLTLAMLLRDGLNTATGRTAVFPQHADAVAAHAGRRSPDELADQIEAVALAEQMLDRNVAPQLTCERVATALGGVQVRMDVV